jgi:hypothetical protein
MASKSKPRKKVTFNCYPADKKLMKDTVAKVGLVHPDDNEADILHNLILDYRKCKRLDSNE